MSIVRSSMVQRRRVALAIASFLVSIQMVAAALDPVAEVPTLTPGTAEHPRVAYVEMQAVALADVPRTRLPSRLASHLGRIAEERGFQIVVDSRDGAIVWSRPDVDVTSASVKGELERAAAVRRRQERHPVIDDLTKEAIRRVRASATPWGHDVPLSPPIRRIRLDLKSKSDTAHFDVARLAELCVGVGIVFVSDDASATAKIRYETYSSSTPYGFLGAPSYGINVVYAIELDPDANAARRFTIRGSAVPPAEIPISISSLGSSAGRRSSIVAAALNAFQWSPEYRLTCPSIAAAFGDHLQATRLLPWAVVSDAGRDLLKTLHFVADTDDERAMLAVAERDFQTAATFGALAVPPTLLLFNNTMGQFRDDLGTSVFWRRERDVLGALEILSRFGDERAAADLVRFLDMERQRNWRRPPKVFRALFDALARLGDASTVQALERRQGDPDAARALAQLRQKLVHQ